MRFFRFVFVALLLLFQTNIIFGGSPVAVQQFINHKDWSFVENKGQLAPTLKGDDGVSDIRYYSHEGGAHIYCRPGKICFVFSKQETENNPSISEATGLPISDVG